MTEPETWVLSDDEFRAVSALEPQRRYDHFVKRVADWGSVWVMRDHEGVALGEPDQDVASVAVWPHPRYAAAGVENKRTVAEPIQLQTWLSYWLPKFAAADVLMNVFPTPDGQGLMVEPLAMKHDLEAESVQYD